MSKNHNSIEIQCTVEINYVWFNQFVWYGIVNLDSKLTIGQKQSKQVESISKLSKFFNFSIFICHIHKPICWKVIKVYSPCIPDLWKWNVPILNQDVNSFYCSTMLGLEIKYTIRNRSGITLKKFSYFSQCCLIQHILVRKAL